MAIADVSATDKDAVRAFLKCLQDLVRSHSCRTKGTDSPKIGRVLKAADTCQVCSRVCAPIAQKAYYGGFKLLVGHN